MRIVLINWAPIREGAARGGGVNGYAQALAAELVGKGHEVVSLSGGVRCDADGRCRIERLQDWQEVATYEVVNSPVLAPSLDQFKEPLGEVSAPTLELEIESFIRSVRPDIVHWHNIEGFSAGCIPAVRRGAPGTRIFFSLHNYHTVCPQVYLMQGHRRPCRSFDNGHACTSCIPAIEPAQIRIQRLAGPAPARVAPPPASPQTPIEYSGSSWPPRFVPGRGPHPYYAEDVPAWRPLTNEIAPEPPSTKPPTPYAARRAAMVAMLNQCDRVLAVSRFVRSKFIAMGVQPDRIATLHIGSRMTQLAREFRSSRHRRPDSLVDGAGRPLRPIRLAFMGYNNWYKGLPMLADSLDLLVPEVLARFHLHVYALEGKQMEPQFRALEPRLGGLTLVHGYEYERIPELLEGIDLGLVTSVWWDNAPQTVMEFASCGVPVLAAELGGIPDFVRDGENGLLFRGNDRWDFARRLASIAANPGVIPALAARVVAPKTMAEHVGELERLYADRLS